MTKRRKRELEGTLEVEGYPLRWRLRSEQIWDAQGDHLACACRWSARTRPIAS